MYPFPGGKKSMPQNPWGFLLSIFSMVAYEGQLLKRKCFTFILGNITYHTHITSNYIINLAANQNQLDTLEILISQHLGWRSLTALSEETYIVHNFCVVTFFFLWREPIYNDVEFMNLEFLSKKKVLTIEVVRISISWIHLFEYDCFYETNFEQ